MKKSFAFLSLLVGATACTTVVDFDIPLNKPWIVVNSLFSADSVWRVQLTYSKNILDTSPGSIIPVGNAVVTILDLNNQVIETMTPSSDKFNPVLYKGKTKPLPGQAYTVQVAIKNEPVLQAANKVPTHVPMHSVAVDSSRFISDGEPIEIKISFNDPGNERNFYTVKIIEDAFYLTGKMVNNVIKWDTIWYTQEVYFEVVNQSLTSDETGLEKLINDSHFNGKEYTFHLKMHSRHLYGSTFVPRNTRLTLLSVTEEYYKYFSSKVLQESKAYDPFAQPVQVFTNVENGLGIFAGYSPSVYKLK
jgi:hypothetical protein